MDIFYRKQSTTDNPVRFLLVKALDHITGIEVGTPTITIMKSDETTFSVADGALTHTENGIWSWAADADDRDTVGDAVGHVELTGADPYDFILAVQTDDPYNIVSEIWSATTRTLTAISSTLRNQLADNIWRRSAESIEDSADGDAKSFRSPLGAISKLINKVAFNPDGTLLSIYETDDTTVLGTQTPTTDSSADPVTGLDTN